MDWRTSVNSHNGCLKVYMSSAIDLSLSLLINCFVLSCRLPMYIWGSIRFFLIIVNNLYCIPTHCLWLLTLSPLKWFLPKVYLTLEGFGFQWLLSMVSAWSYTAGYSGISLNLEHSFQLVFLTLCKFYFFFSYWNGWWHSQSSQW
jgi:hypothetical protein